MACRFFSAAMRSSSSLMPSVFLLAAMRSYVCASSSWTPLSWSPSCPALALASPICLDTSAMVPVRSPAVNCCEPMSAYARLRVASLVAVSCAALLNSSSCLDDADALTSSPSPLRARCSLVSCPCVALTAELMPFIAFWSEVVSAPMRTVRPR